MQDVTQKRKEVESFLRDFRVKKGLREIHFLDDRGKNFITLSLLEIRPVDREKVVDSLIAEDYSEGPIPEDWYGSKEMWVFGKLVKNTEIYIKITLGAPGSKTICISFHPSEHPMSYPLKST